MDAFPIWPYIRHNLAVFLFLLIAASGMLAVYYYFSPAGEAPIQAVSAAGEGVSLSVPISKPVSGRQVRQRFAQSDPPLKIALIVGHRGSDSGAVCDDGLTELSINTTIAEKAVLLLAEQGVEVLLFDEFDVRLTQFEGTAVISIHADSCGVFDETTTGFKIAGTSRTDASHLVSCMEQEYGRATGLTIHANTITTHMTDYHAFRKVGLGTPTIILEAGFMFLDRELLTTKSDLPAEGVANGVLCFLGK